VAGARLPERLLVNDLEAAAISLCPAIAPALDAVGEAGAEHAFVSGSGPTVAGLFWGEDGPQTAAAAAATLRERFPDAISAVPVAPDSGTI
jgi:4-diphosphocytidyl-2-C-methyl-D-erythritol kinase